MRDDPIKQEEQVEDNELERSPVSIGDTIYYYGMLNQLIASRGGRISFGCWFSTFSSHINRMIGYHADKLKLPGYEDGLVESY